MAMAFWNKDKPNADDMREAMDAAAKKRRIVQLGRQNEIYASLLLEKARELREVLERDTAAG